MRNEPAHAQWRPLAASENRRLSCRETVERTRRCRGAPRASEMFRGVNAACPEMNDLLLQAFSCSACSHS
ncbi:hypothetical protein AOLI_G00188770 [Acnodon oligacanthus]